MVAESLIRKKFSILLWRSRLERASSTDREAILVALLAFILLTLIVGRIFVERIRLISSDGDEHLGPDSNRVLSKDIRISFMYFLIAGYLFAAMLSLSLWYLKSYTY